MTYLFHIRTNRLETISTLMKDFWPNTVLNKTKNGVSAFSCALKVVEMPSI